MAVLRQCEENLLKVAYQEFSKYPNLFYRKSSNGLFFVDMRGTKNVPIWEEPVPLIYWRFGKAVPEWKRMRQIKEEFSRLDNQGISIRVNHSSEFPSYEAGDGYCRECRTDFQASGSYCSDECASKALKRRYAMIMNRAPTCGVCKRKIVEDSYLTIASILGANLTTSKVKHHVSYARDETILVCRSCHAKIHLSEDPTLKTFRPEDRRPQKPIGMGLEICPVCHHNKIRPGSEFCKECKRKARRRAKKYPNGPPPPPMKVTCKKCGTVFEGSLRTTCPKCREFFR